MRSGREKVCGGEEAAMTAITCPRCHQEYNGGHPAVHVCRPVVGLNYDALRAELGYEQRIAALEAVVEVLTTNVRALRSELGKGE